MRFALCSLLLGLGFIAGCSSGEEKAEAATKAPEEPLTVETATAQLRTLDRSIYVTGSLSPEETVSVSAEVPGKVAALYVDFGHDVRKGQVIAELDKQELTLQLERSKAALAQALARLGLEPGQEYVRPESTPVIRQAQAQMEDARSKYKNASSLVKTGDISQERFTEIEKQYQARLAALEAARDEARTLEANVHALQAEVALAQKRLRDATVRAPFDGTVSEKHVSVGQYLKENVPIVTIVKTHPLRLRLEVPETATGSVKVGTELRFKTDAAPGVEFTARIRELNPSLDPKSRTLTAEARLGKADPRLRPGMFVQVQLVLSKGVEAVLVPREAIYTVAGLTKLFVVKDGQAREHRITTGQEVDSWIEVPREAVNPGDQVAVSELSQLVSEQPVKAVPRG